MKRMETSSLCALPYKMAQGIKTVYVQVNAMQRPAEQREELRISGLGLEGSRGVALPTRRFAQTGADWLN